ncbi:MAG: 2,3-bisphosphoglycerate-independent phosphoglycerate mutase [Bacilli bacterium]
MKKSILVIMDGYGLSNNKEGNAIMAANTPTLDMLFNTYPNTRLEASGLLVGLPEGQMGNSEVGHLNIGAGRLIYQDLLKITNSIENRNFFSNKALNSAIDNCEKNTSNLHIYGLISDGGVHSHLNHLMAVLDLCKARNFTRVYLHAFLDGRDTEPLVAKKYVDQIQNKMNNIGIGKIATIGGRYYAMNRDRNWELTKMAYDAMVLGISDIKVNSINEAFEKEYYENLTDEFMKPTVILENGKPISTIAAKDSIISFNFRSDRMIQLLHAFNDEEFNDFNRSTGQIKTCFVCMTPYLEENPYENVLIAFPQDSKIENTIGEYLSKCGKTQIRISEFEKSQHVTYFFDGCEDVVKAGEEIVIFPRPEVFTYDEIPEMQSEKITNAVLAASATNKYDFILVNYPNCDAVGHSGKLSETIKAVEAVDKAIGKIISNVNLENVNLFITADHGNAEEMINLKTGEPNKKHTTNLVPFIFCNTKYSLSTGKLSDITPTILKASGLEIPNEMTGRALID